ncbi:hypothetical protein LLEC1_08059 [Akanthomyces lecanii]|uniref:RING-type E3 ubiquitin transferase n=1 Tax=Cordyceps confragosa TaxID=2714763 RepID=A0A179I8N1_CORDF|nr:hypothetical protein LLEC1_08059 [Akanthomyces lecanii]
MLQDQLLTLHTTAPTTENRAFLEQLISSLDNEIQDPPASLKGVSQEFVDGLDRVSRKKLHDDDDCAICKIPYLEDEWCLVVELPCKGRHQFDLECVGPWLRSVGTCPMCREEMMKKKEAPVVQDDEEEEDGDMMRLDQAARLGHVHLLLVQGAGGRRQAVQLLAGVPEPLAGRVEVQVARRLGRVLLLEAGAQLPQAEVERRLHPAAEDAGGKRVERDPFPQRRVVLFAVKFRLDWWFFLQGVEKVLGAVGIGGERLLEELVDAAGRVLGRRGRGRRGRVLDLDVDDVGNLSGESVAGGHLGGLERSRRHDKALPPIKTNHYASPRHDLLPFHGILGADLPFMYWSEADDGQARNFAFVDLRSLPSHGAAQQLAASFDPNTSYDVILVAQPLAQPARHESKPTATVGPFRPMNINSN